VLCCMPWRSSIGKRCSSEDGYLEGHIWSHVRCQLALDMSICKLTQLATSTVFGWFVC